MAFLAARIIHETAIELPGCRTFLLIRFQVQSADEQGAAPDPGFKNDAQLVIEVVVVADLHEGSLNVASFHKNTVLPEVCFTAYAP